MRSVMLGDLSKGIDLISTIPMVQPGFTPDARNFVLADHGGVDKILGYSAFATIPANGNAIFAWERQGASSLLITSSSSHWYSVNSGGTPTAIRGASATPASTMTTMTTDPTFVSFGTKLYGMDDQNPMASWDGSTLVSFAAGATTGPPLGRILGIVKGRMFVVPASNQMQLVWSDPLTFGGVTGYSPSWPATNNATLTSPYHNDRIVGAVVVPDGLVVFCQFSTFLVYDFTSGYNNLIDPQRGCENGKSLAMIEGNIYGISRDGIFTTHGNSPLKIVTDLVEPLFSRGNPIFTNACGAIVERKYLGSFQRGQTSNDMTIEVYERRNNAAMLNDYPMYAATTSRVQDGYDRLFFVDATDRTKIRRGYSGGSFAGNPITCYYEMPPIDMGLEANLKRLKKVRVVGRGNMLLRIKRNYSQVADVSAAIGFPATAAGSQWDSAVWDVSKWGGYSMLEGWSRPQCAARTFGFRFEETSSDVSEGRPSPYGTSSIVGAAGLFLVEPHYEITSRERVLNA